MPGEPAAELRVHGVGGSTGARILGLESEHEPILVAQGGRTFFWRRPGEPHIEGYVWGGLTTDSRLQAFWILLLPFTLLNVAGWMHEPATEDNKWRLAWIRALILALALSLTATYVIWLTAVIVNDIGYTWVPQHFAWASPRLGVLMGTVALALLIVALAVLARRTRGGERYVESFGSVFGAAVANSTRGKWFGITNNETLRDLAFFNRAHDSGELIAIHFGVAITILLALVGWAFAAAGHDARASQLPHYLEVTLLATGAVQVVLLFVLAVVSFTTRPTGFRYCGPAVAAALAIALANGMLAGVARVVDSRLHIKPGDEFLLADVVVATFVMLFVTALWWAVRWHVWPARLGDVADVAHNSSPAGTAANGATKSMLRKTAAFRGLTRGLVHLDVVLSLTAATFFGLAVTASLLRFHDRTHFRSRLLAVAGTQLIAYGGLALVLVMWTNRSNPKMRKTVGIVWDLLTFWPRRFHPFAVRPYSEQAVPELRGRLLVLRPTFERVLLSVHSQGTILAAAALAPLVDVHAPQATQITLVTFGSPIGGLYGMAFPAYFNAELTETIHGGLTSWRNFRRRTDPIASEITSVPTIWLDSPGVTPAQNGGELRVPATLAERDRYPWVCVETHSNYRNEPLLKEIVDELRQ